MHHRPVAAILPRARRPQPSAPVRLAAILALAGALSACARPPSAFSPNIADPSDPAARVAATTYRSPFDSYRSQRPVQPASWREQNERVAPKPKP